MAPAGGCTQSKGETLDLLLATHLPTPEVIEGSGTRCCPPHQTFGLAGGYKNCNLPESGMGERLIRSIKQSRYGWDIPSSAARGMGNTYPLPRQDFLFLPDDWICASHMVPG